MKKQSIFFFTQALLVSIALLHSCKADVDLNDVSSEIEWNVNLALPIASSHVTIEDVLGDTVIDGLMMNEDGSFYYEDKHETAKMLDDISIRNQVFLSDEEFDIDSKLPTLTMPANVKHTLTFDLGFNPSRFTDNIHVGFFSYSTSTSGAGAPRKVSSSFFDEDARVEGADVAEATLSFELKEATLNAAGIRYEDIDSITIEFDENVFKLGSKQTYCIPTDKAFNQSHKIFLEDLHLNFVDPQTDILYDTCVVKYNFYLNTKAERTLNTSSSIFIDFYADLVEVDVVYGEFAMQNIIRTGDTVTIDGGLYEDGWSIPFKNPEIRISAVSHWGLPLRADILYIKAVTQEDTDIFANFAGYENPLSPSFSLFDVPNVVGDSIFEELPVIDKDFGGTDAFFKTYPKYLIYEWALSVDTTKKDVQQYLMANSGGRLNMNMIFPLEFDEGLSLGYQDTLRNLDFSGIVMDYGNLKIDAFLTVESAFPFDVDGQFVFLDEAYNELPITLFESDGDNRVTFNKAEVDAEGNVTTPSKRQLQIEVNAQEDYSTIKNVIYKVKVGNDASKAIINKDNGLSVKIAAAIAGDVTLDVDSISNL